MMISSDADEFNKRFVSRIRYNIDIAHGLESVCVSTD